RGSSRRLLAVREPVCRVERLSRKEAGRNIFSIYTAIHRSEGSVMESNNALKAKMLALAITIGAGAPATTVRADELQDLKAQVEALQKKVRERAQKQETAEKKQAAAVPDNDVTGGATKGSYKLPGSNHCVTRGR